MILRETWILDQGEYVTGCPLGPNQVVANSVKLRLASEAPGVIKAVGTLIYSVAFFLF